MISFAITVKDEIEEIKRLLLILLDKKNQEDEIVILVDEPKTTLDIKLLLNGLKMSQYGLLGVDSIHVYYEEFKNDFAAWKNKLTTLCKGDYIFQIDADESPCESLLNFLPDLIKMNIDVYFLPRENTVEGLTENHIKKWGWRVDDKGWVNWPDRQGRLYKNIPQIKWESKVHERLTGYKTFVNIDQQELRLIHPKSIQRQERQNDYYNTL